MRSGTNPASGLAWHTDDETLRRGFDSFGNIEEAVSNMVVLISIG